MVQICSIWVQIGVPRSRRIERVDEIRSLVEEELVTSLSAFKEAEQVTLDMLKQYKLETICKINKMLGDLRLPPYEIPEGLSLSSLAKLLYHKFSELNKLKTERMEKWAEFDLTKTNLCNRLGCGNKPFKTLTDIPNDQELMEFQSQVLELNQLLNQKQQKFDDHKAKITKLIADTEYEISEDFEKNILDPKHEFILSDSNIVLVQLLEDKLTFKFEENESSRKRMLDKLESLWEKLSVDAKEQQKVKKITKNSKPSTLKLLQDEVSRLEEIKRQNISIFIEKIRPEIEQWWENCCICEQEMTDFREKYFNDDRFTEELLDIHEQELDRLKNLYNENEEIFVKCEKWRSYWIRFRELEVKSKDPNRFNNRGGALLQEERERKQLQKGIPKLENELKQLAKAWSIAHNDEVFTIYGRPIERYFTDYWEMYNQKRENEKEKKKNVKKQELEAEVRGLRSTSNITLKKTPVKRGNTPAVNSPATSEKQRKLDTFSSVKRTDSEQPDVIVRKNFAKNLKQDFDKITRSAKQPTKLESIANLENSIVDEIQFQSVSFDENAL